MTRLFADPISSGVTGSDPYLQSLLAARERSMSQKNREHRLVGTGRRRDQSVANRDQDRVISVTVCLIVLMVLVPPWLYLDGNTSNQESAGYHFLFNPPPVTTYQEMFGVPEDEVWTTRAVRVHMNWIRLTVQILAVVLFGMGFALRQKTPRPATWGVYVAFGLIALGFLALLMFLRF
jgi:hypothetical protein